MPVSAIRMQCAPLIVLLTVFPFENKLRSAAATVLARADYVDVTIEGAQARIYFPALGGPGHRGLGAVLNGQSHKTYLGLETLRRIRSGRHIFAIIDGQDASAPPFASAASGWGNEIYRKRYIALYRYLREHYDIETSVDLIGASMGGLAMGRFIVDQPFPVGHAYGLGPVPDLRRIFDRGGDTRKIPIRNAYGMDPSGFDDRSLEDIAADVFWLTDLAGAKRRLPPLKILAGNGDTVFIKEFGGGDSYRRLCRTYTERGGQCFYWEMDGMSHDDHNIIPGILNDLEAETAHETSPIS